MNDKDTRELNILSEKVKNNEATEKEKSRFFSLLNAILKELKQGLKEDLNK